jgi:hypothetical protein
MCVGDHGFIGINYEWARGIAPPSQGVMYNTPKLGSVDKKIIYVDTGPGYAELTYTAKKPGTEKIESSLFYGKYFATDTTTIQVFDCNYELIINAKDDVNQEDVIITSKVYADGYLQADTNNNVTGIIDYTAGVNITSNNDILSCVLKPPVGASSPMTITGTVTENTFSKTVHLNLSFKPVTLPSANEVCIDKRKQVATKNVPFFWKRAYDPGTNLQTTLDFTVYGMFFSKIKGSYGGGTAEYTLIPVIASSSGNGQ